MASYLKTTTLSTLVLVLAVASLNWLVDPYAVWHNRCWEGYNCRKTEAGDKVYLTKSLQWHHLNPDIVIHGNSRSELGIDPDSPAFEGRRVYNLSLRGAGIATQVEYLINLLELHRPERVIMSLDFLDFLIGADKFAAWPPRTSQRAILPLTLTRDDNPHYRINQAKGLTSALLSLDATLDSLKTLLRQQQPVNFTTLSGFNQADGFIPIIRYEGIGALFEQKLQELDRRLQNRHFSLLDRHQNSTSFRSLALLIKQLQQHKIRLDLFISPYHQQYLERIEKHGHRPLFLNWKQMLVERLAQLQFFEQGQLFDYSRLNRYTTEAVPTAKKVEMRWYWEPAHYRSELGEIIVGQILTSNPEFKLTPQNLQQRLADEQIAWQGGFAQRPP